MTQSTDMDKYGRRIIANSPIPDPDDSIRFDVWRGGVLDPGTVLTYWDHPPRRRCVGGWIRSQDWWFVCGACHPNRKDTQTGQSKNERKRNPHTQLERM